MCLCVKLLWKCLMLNRTESDHDDISHKLPLKTKQEESSCDHCNCHHHLQHHDCSHHYHHQRVLVMATSERRQHDARTHSRTHSLSFRLLCALCLHFVGRLAVCVINYVHQQGQTHTHTQSHTHSHTQQCKCWRSH